MHQKIGEAPEGLGQRARGQAAPLGTIAQEIVPCDGERGQAKPGRPAQEGKKIALESGKKVLQPNLTRSCVLPRTGGLS